MTETPETARALLYRHGLPEDVIDGVLALHAQELVAVQREALTKTDDPVFYESEAGWLIDLIDPTTAPAPAADRAAVRAVWIDGHPQLEAIAAAVWEKCGRSDSGSCVEDDPRNIAVAAFAAVLPASTGRAAVLSESERTMLRYALDQAQEAIWFQDGFTDEDQAAVDRLRRMADETPQEAPWLSDSARIGRALIWSWSDNGKGERGEGYRAAQVEVRALLTGQRDSNEAQQPAPAAPAQPDGEA